MSDNADYNKLINQKSNAQARYNSCKSRIENCDYLLSRLRPAKESIKELKFAFKKTKKADKVLCGGKYSWRGSTYDEFDLKMMDLMHTNDAYYIGSIDYVLDSINNEITRIENQRLSEYGLLGQLGSWINSLSNQIENFFN